MRTLQLVGKAGIFLLAEENRNRVLAQAVRGREESTPLSRAERVGNETSRRESERRVSSSVLFLSSPGSDVSPCLWDF